MENPFFKNFGKKTISIFIAILLWIVANLEFDIEKNINIPVTYSNLGSNLIVTSNPPQSIDIKLRGPRSQISTLTNSNTVFNFDLATFKAGMGKIEINGDELNFPREVDIIGISPSFFEIKIDELGTKTIKVEPIFNEPGEGYITVGDPKISPSTVKISGPKKMLSDTTKLTTDPIDLKGEKSEISIQVQIKTPSPLIKIIDDKVARVTLDIEEVNLEKEFKDVKIEFKNFKDISYELVKNGKANLVFDGPFSIINKLSNDDIEVFVDGKGINNESGETHNLKVKVVYPDSNNLKLTKLKPETVKIKIN